SHLIRFGQREIETIGVGLGFWSDLYHRSMTVYWPVFFGSSAHSSEHGTQWASHRWLFCFAFDHIDSEFRGCLPIDMPKPNMRTAGPLYFLALFDVEHGRQEGTF